MTDQNLPAIIEPADVVTEPLAVEPGPIPILAGTFAIYESSTGPAGYAIVANVDGVRHQKFIPAALIKTVGRLAGVGGGVSSLFGR